MKLFRILSLSAVFLYCAIAATKPPQQQQLPPTVADQTGHRDLQAQSTCLSRVRRRALQPRRCLLARRTESFGAPAQEALALLDAHKVPLSSWSDTDERRAEIRQSIQDVLKKTIQ